MVPAFRHHARVAGVGNFADDGSGHVNQRRFGQQPVVTRAQNAVSMEERPWQYASRDRREPAGSTFEEELMGSTQTESRVSRRTFLQATVASAAAASLPAPTAARSATRVRRAGVSRDLFAELDARIEAGMAAYGIPGVAAGVQYGGRQYLKGYGITNVDYPQAVDPDTVFEVGSTTKTFTGTTVMRLVEQGKLDLDARVRRYLPDFRTSDPAVAERVTLRQLLNHTPGWLGEDLHDTGRGEDALAKYVAGIVRLPQLTPPGEVFAYNNRRVVLGWAADRGGHRKDV
jgi:hypothetical protein